LSPSQAFNIPLMIASVIYSSYRAKKAFDQKQKLAVYCKQVYPLVRYIQWSTLTSLELKEIRERASSDSLDCLKIAMKAAKDAGTAVKTVRSASEKLMVLRSEGDSNVSAEEADGLADVERAVTKAVEEATYIWTRTAFLANNVFKLANSAHDWTSSDGIDAVQQKSRLLKDEAKTAEGLAEHAKILAEYCFKCAAVSSIKVEAAEARQKLQYIEEAQREAEDQRLQLQRKEQEAQTEAHLANAHAASLAKTAFALWRAKWASKKSQESKTILFEAVNAMRAEKETEHQVGCLAGESKT